MAERKLAYFGDGGSKEEHGLGHHDDHCNREDRGDWVEHEEGNRGKYFCAESGRYGHSPRGPSYNHGDNESGSPPQRSPGTEASTRVTLDYCSGGKSDRRPGVRGVRTHKTRVGFASGGERQTTQVSSM